ncbi:EC1118_1L32_0023p [Saccharomyces cerevisiae EC1118]|uniref:EC1118_1L32_0023p n=1 Tax=Saccharomyces cerevisiae (strain Lalvin EC1118 / Prise de mousse) TaxID=643680 RepID=C8ZDD2_YEAS8|nr:EC1118_1L32_0023p [Saccharomyces cerevisiae EC1118]
MAYAHGCYSIYHSQVTLLSHSNPWPISHFISTKCTHITINGTCLSGLYPVPFTHKAHDYPHFNIYILFCGPKYCINALNTYFIPLLHHILTTQFIHTYANITKKSPLKSPKHKNILSFNHNT